MYRVNLMTSTPLTAVELRTLCVRQVTCACCVLAALWGGTFVLRYWGGCSSAQASSKMGDSAEQIERCRAELEESERVYRWLSESNESRAQPAQILIALEKIMPSDVWLREIVVSEGSVRIIGLSRSESSVANFQGGLVDSGVFRHPRLESSQVAHDVSTDCREFRISADMAPRRGER